MTTLWALLLAAACPRPGVAGELPPGPERVQARLESNLADERRLEAFDINGASRSFSLLGDLEGTTMILRVDDAEGNPVGVFKPTNGSTYHRAELAAYRLAKRLRLPAYPATVIKTLDRGSLDAFRGLLEARAFEFGEDDPATGHFRQKERNRAAMLAELRGLESLEGVFKAWVSPLIFYYELGTVDTIRKHPVYENLKRGGPPPQDEWIDVVQCTKRFEPMGCIEVKINRLELVEQFTGILLIDALIGNRDRLAGGNLHVRSRTGRLFDLGEERYAMAFPELLSLDNGASFQSDPGYGLRLLTEELGIARFSREHRDALKALARDLESDSDGVMASLGLERSYSRGGTFEPMAILDRNLSGVLSYLERLESDLGEAAFF